MRVRFLFAAIMLGTVPQLAARAADAPPSDPVLAEVGELAGYVMFVNSGAPGMVLAMVRDGHSVVVGYGETELGNHREPDGKSLVRLNSITKVFATEVLVSLVADGKIQLTDPLQKFAGEAKVPAFEGRQITLLDLATHSAGMPREMGALPPGAGARNWPTRADRWSWLPSYTLPWAPGAITSYSNVGFDLLADAVETAGGKPYPELLRTRVTAPLEMGDTSFAPTAEQCSRLMIGSGFGGIEPCGDTHATGGSGGLYSTANDMAIWLRHNLDDPTEVLALSHAAYRPRQTMPAALGFDEAGPMAELGLGWVITASDGIKPALLGKSGGGVGFMSYTALAPGRGVGLFVAMNRVDFSTFSGMTAAANAMIDELATR